MQQRTYVKNAALLTATSLVLRVVGMFFRIYLAAHIGATGMGLYQLIFTVYGLAVILATAGVSVVATRIVAGLLAKNKQEQVRASMHKIMWLGLLLGLAAAGLLFVGAGFAAEFWLQDMRAVLSLRILAPSLPFMALSAVLRGYFMACRKVGPNARAQSFEQGVRIILVMLLLDAALEKGLGVACAAVVLGNTVSEALSWGYLYLCYLREAKPQLQRQIPSEYSVKSLSTMLAPIAAGQYMTGALRTLENVLVPMCLAMFLNSREVALAQYGALKGMAMPVLFFPFSFITTLSTLLLPEITAAYEKKQIQVLQRLVSRVMLLTLSVSMLAGGVFTTFAYPLGELIYQSKEIGLYIIVLGPLTPLMYLESMVDGILKGMNEQLATFRYTIVDSLMRIALIWLLLPRFGMWGFLFVMVLSNLLTSLLNLQRLLKVVHLPFCWMSWLIKPLFAAAMGACAVFGAERWLQQIPSAMICMAVSATLYSAIYACVLFLSGGVKISDFLVKNS